MVCELPRRAQALYLDGKGMTILNESPVIVIDPKGDPEVLKQLQACLVRGEVVCAECIRRGVRFLPKQILRALFAKAGLQDGLTAKPRRHEFMVPDFSMASGPGKA